MTEDCPGCRKRDAFMAMILAERTAMHLEIHACSGDGPEGAGVKEFRAAIEAGDFQAAAQVWDRWLRPQIQALGEMRRTAFQWEILVKSLVTIVAERLEKEGGPSAAWAAKVTESWAELSEAWDTHDDYRMSRSVTPWLRWTLLGLVERVAEREWRTFVDGLPPELQALAAENPPTKQAEITATAFEIAEWHRREHGIDLFEDD